LRLAVTEGIAECTPNFAGLITRGSYNTARARAADSDRNATQRRIVALLHGRVESVHIDVDDTAETQR
jgi:hypothetical protein